MFLLGRHAPWVMTLALAGACATASEPGVDDSPDDTDTGTDTDDADVDGNPDGDDIDAGQSDVQLTVIPTGPGTITERSCTACCTGSPRSPTSASRHGRGSCIASTATPAD